MLKESDHQGRRSKDIGTELEIEPTLGRIVPEYEADKARE